jgi:hypothetical protein
VILAGPDVDCDDNIAREVMGVSRGRLIQTGERTRDTRAPILERVKTDRGD